MIGRSGLRGRQSLPLTLETADKAGGRSVPGELDDFADERLGVARRATKALRRAGFGGCTLLQCIVSQSYERKLLTRTLAK